MNCHDSIRAGQKPALIKVGNTTLKIYKGKSHGYGLFTLVWYEAGVRRRKAFGTLEKAKSEAKLIAIRIENNERDVLKLSTSDQSSYAHAMTLLAPFGIPLHAAIEEYVKAREAAGGASLYEVARFYAKHASRKLEAKLLPKVVEEFMESREAAQMSERYLSDSRLRLGRLAKAFTGFIGNVTQKELDLWLQGMKLGPRSRKNYRNITVTLFRFAQQRDYLPEGKTEAERVPTVKDKGGEIGIFTPKEMQKLLNAANEEDLPYLSIRAFSGLRDAEALRLDWEHVLFDKGYIEVPAKSAKTASRRLIPLHDNLRAWLKPHRKARGGISEGDPIARIAGTAAVKAKVKWKNNALRHSYASYRLAQTTDAAKTALELGNSPAKLFSNYRELVTPEEAQEWFSIMPAPRPQTW